MKTVKGRMNALPVLFDSFRKNTVVVQLTNEKIMLFEDGSAKRTCKNLGLMMKRNGRK